MRFANRTAGGERLAARLARYAGDDVVVLGLPRGGVPVAAEVARRLHAPLDVLVVRKLGVPFQPELGMGAVGEGGVRVLNEDVVRAARVRPEDLAAVDRRERTELARRVLRYREGRRPAAVAGRVAVVVDDGVATGATARAACQVARALGARSVVLAVPVAPADVAERIGDVADEVVAVTTTAAMGAIGEYYDDFRQTGDQEVVDLLARARQPLTRAAPPGRTPPATRDGPAVPVPVGDRVLSAQVGGPAEPRGVVVFAHGSGSGRHSPRNRFVADVLARAGLATVLVDLLDPEEELDRRSVFDVERLAERLTAVTDRVRDQPRLAGRPLGLFGASTGAAAALWAAADPRVGVRAVVSRGGRPDLAAARLPAVHVPVLLIVGGRDRLVSELNRQARTLLGGPSRLAVVRHASHLFVEPGALAEAAALARDFFAEHLAGSPVGGATVGG